jgi:23S rRNA pseudouridine2605 synthase
MQIRLNKFLSQAGVASRREADRMIEEGRVRVNNQLVEELGYKIDDEKDRVEVNGKKVTRDKELIYLVLNKPAGYLVTCKDPFQRPTIKSLLVDLEKRVFPIGRLDCQSEGLLLLTNDGELAYRLTHPRYKIKKIYLVKIKGELDSSDLDKLERGVLIDGKKTAPAKVALLASSPKKSLLKIAIHEGKKREVRKMCEVIGHEVLELKRIAFAGLKLNKLGPGKWRYLTHREIAKLKELVEIG